MTNFIIFVTFLSHYANLTAAKLCQTWGNSKLFQKKKRKGKERKQKRKQEVLLQVLKFKCRCLQILSVLTWSKCCFMFKLFSASLTLHKPLIPKRLHAQKELAMHEVNLSLKLVTLLTSVELLLGNNRTQKGKFNVVTTDIEQWMWHGSHATWIQFSR